MRRGAALAAVVIALATPLVALGFGLASGSNGTTATVEVAVWQRVSDGALYLSTRPEGGRWTTHGEPLDMSALSASGRFRQGSAITVEVPVVAPVPAEPTPPGEGSRAFFSVTFINIDGELHASAAHNFAAPHNVLRAHSVDVTYSTTSGLVTEECINDKAIFAGLELTELYCWYPATARAGDIDYVRVDINTSLWAATTFACEKREIDLGNAGSSWVCYERQR